jgi:hypothetical protein
MTRYTLAGIFLLIGIALVEWNALCAAVFIGLAAVLTVRRKGIARR